MVRLNYRSYHFLFIYIVPIHFEMKKYITKNNFKISCIYQLLIVPLFQQLKQGGYYETI